VIPPPGDDAPAQPEVEPLPKCQCGAVVERPCDQYGPPCFDAMLGGFDGIPEQEKAKPVRGTHYQLQAILVIMPGLLPGEAARNVLGWTTPMKRAVEAIQLEELP
jgi:hypothetical protein